MGVEGDWSSDVCSSDLAYGNQSVNEVEVRSMLGAIDQTYLFDIINSLLAQNGAGLIEMAKQMEARSISFEAALNDLANLLHQIAMAQTVPNSIADDLPERALLLDLAQKLSPETLQLYYQITLLGRRDIGLAPDEFAGFTMTLLRMLAFAPSEKVTDKPVATHAAPNQNKTAALESIPKDALEAAPTLVLNPAVFDGNWRKLVEQNLKLGLVRALAQNCELVTFDESSLTLRVAENQKHLVSANYQEKLSSAINEYFGRKIRLNFEVNSEANTPAKQNAVEKANIKSNAEAAIMQDSFVQALIQDFDAAIIPNSIKPI
jgi:DNA polymerase-3 subunit gamma/tau